MNQNNNALEAATRFITTIHPGILLAIRRTPGNDFFIVTASHFDFYRESFIGAGGS